MRSAACPYIIPTRDLLRQSPGTEYFGGDEEKRKNPKYGIWGSNSNSANSPDDVWTVVTPLGWPVVGLMAARIRSVIFEILGIYG